MAVPAGFEPAISALTTRRLGPLTDGTNKIDYNKDQYRSQAYDRLDFDGEYLLNPAMGPRLRPDLPTFDKPAFSMWWGSSA